MMKTVAASVVMGLAVGQSDDDYYKKEFEKFVHRFGKSYHYKEEETMRFNEFKRTFKVVASHNAKGKPYTMGINEFADITQEEMKLRNGYKPQHANKTYAEKPLSVFSYSGAPLDAAIDWRTKGAVTPVKNQGQCGSCWAFSTVAGMEGAWFIAGHPLSQFSEQQLNDCDWSYWDPFSNKGCSGGNANVALNWEKSQIVCTEASYPYFSGGTGKRGQCQSSCATGIPMGGVTGYTLVTPNSEDALAEALMQQPVSVSIDASCDSFTNYQSGIWDGCGTGIDHAVTAVGYTSGAWIVKNSWGVVWGDQGYVYFQRGTGGEGTSGILNGPVFPTVTAGSGPEPSPSPSPTPGPGPSPYGDGDGNYGDGDGKNVVV